MSVEQKIREAIANKCYINPTFEELDEINEAVEAILQIIESDVIGEDSDEKLDSWYEANNRLRAKQRANLREEK